MFGKLINILKENRRRLFLQKAVIHVFWKRHPAFWQVLSFLPILVGNKDEIAKAAEESAFNIRGAEIIDPMEYEDIDEMAECLYELRKNKGMTLEKAKATCQQANYFGTMLVKMGKADALLGGATYSTADTVRPALQIIKTKPGKNIVASCFILVRESATGGTRYLRWAIVRLILSQMKMSWQKSQLIVQSVLRFLELTRKLHS